MLTKNGDSDKQEESGKEQTAPVLNIAKIGIVSRDYWHWFENDYRDFSSELPAILKLLDDQGCDAVLFSLYSIVPRDSYDPTAAFQGQKNVKVVFLEEFQDRKKTDAETKHENTTGGESPNVKDKYIKPTDKESPDTKDKRTKPTDVELTNAKDKYTKPTDVELTNAKDKYTKPTNIEPKSEETTSGKTVDAKSKDKKSINEKRFVIHHLTQHGWKECRFKQVFARTTGKPRVDINDFVKKELPTRVVGNGCVLLCGETNGVKYSPKDKGIHGTFGLRAAIPPEVTIVLNPVHDRMTRFEMNLKRKFLSKGNRWVISVWNKGKKDKNDYIRNEPDPAWTVYYNGEEVIIEPLVHPISKIEIGIVEISKA